MRVDRRRALALFGAGSLATGGSAAAQGAGQVRFDHGVASGDPTADRVILWTRITPADPSSGAISYAWSLNPIDRRAGGAKSGRGTTSAAKDFTVKVDVGGLDPGRAYTFTFTSNGATSPMGRTRTLPEGQVEDAVMAIASCSLWQAGYFNAYQAIADLPRVDVVLHLGDYIYEYGPEGYGAESGKKLGRRVQPGHEIFTLGDYRNRHAQTKTDPQLQAAHARAPWIVVWDDHETANDSWVGGAENHQKDEGSWNRRKAAAIKAYYEWMPIREPDGGGFSINRTFEFGDLASLFMLETRLTARDLQLDYATDLNGADGKPDVVRFRKRLADPDRRMMGPSQSDWLRRGLANSVKSGRTWQVLGNQVVMARIGVPDIRAAMAADKFAAATASLGPDGLKRIDRMAGISKLGLPYGLDMWDGYPADRQRLYDLINRAKANAVVVSGDSHAFWANELYDAPEGGKRVAVEFGTTGITSPGAGDALPDVPVGQIMADANREVVYSDQAAKGFVLLTLGRTNGKAEMMAVSTIQEKTFTTSVLKTFTFTPSPDGVSGLKEA
ncbi:MAG: alkaline phosphatase D family protein [Phenylobacterium sp.]|uniref:alkaline phosphatase D family protein n=1 Tax=Phenylobacterium sp. TaxID=1871053 RepID=UPI0030191E9D